MRIYLDEGDGPVAVLLHGQPGSGMDFTRVSGALRGKGLRTVAVDRPGYDGLTPATGFAGNAAALDRLLRQLLPGGEPVFLLGLSWGGGVALRYARDHPERVAGLLLAASVGAPGSVSLTDRMMTWPGAAAGAQWLLPHLAWLVEATSGSALTPADRALTRRAALRWAQRDGWSAFRVEQRALVVEMDRVWADLVPAPYPTTVVQGSRDGYVPAAAGRALARRLDARYVEVPAGHLLNMEVPTLLAAELLALRGPA